MNLVSRLAIAALVLVGLQHSVYSQAVNATLLGAVSDTSGAVVPRVKVVITEQNTNVSKVSLTNESGNYIFPDLAPGTYTVTVELEGFKKEARRDVVLSVNSSARVDLRLQPGNVSETVEITGAPPWGNPSGSSSSYGANPMASAAVLARTRSARSASRTRSASPSSAPTASAATRPARASARPAT